MPYSYWDHWLDEDRQNQLFRIPAAGGDIEALTLGTNLQLSRSEAGTSDYDVSSDGELLAFAGDTIYAWSEILEKSALSGRDDLGALRLRTVAAKDRLCHDFPYKNEQDRYEPAVVLDFDYTVLIPREP